MQLRRLAGVRKSRELWGAFLLRRLLSPIKLRWNYGRITARRIAFYFHLLSAKWSAMANQVRMAREKKQSRIIIFDSSASPEVRMNCATIMNKNYPSALIELSFRRMLINAESSAINLHRKGRESGKHFQSLFLRLHNNFQLVGNMLSNSICN